MSESMETRFARMDQRLRTIEREMGDIKGELKEAAAAVTRTATEMKLVSQELRSALGSAVAAAAKPFDRLAWGWKALVGIGSVVLGFLAAVGGIMSLVDRLK